MTIQERQDELDNEIVQCPRCGRMENWGFIREWGNCNECVGDEMQKNDKFINNNL
jgi:hypothetical protein